NSDSLLFSAGYTCFFHSCTCFFSMDNPLSIKTDLLVIYVSHESIYMIIIVFLSNRKQGENVTKQSFLYGTMILIAASMITRFIGFLNRMITARLMGEEGIGLYMLVMPTLFLLLTLAQIGLPLAIAKNVAEADAKNDYGTIKKIM